jgi:Flp pilus assembly protein TadD, contains TPR repeats
MIAVLLLSLALQVSPELRERVEAGLKAKAAGDLDRAIREFTRVVELAPALPAAHVNLGAVYFEKKDYSAAIPPLRKALELNADLPAAHQMLGAALLSQGFAMEAIPHLEKVQSDDLLGVALLEAGRVRESVDHLEAALQKRPNDPDLLYYLARAHELLSRQLHRRLQSEHADSARAEQLQGETLAASGDYSAAQKHFRAALEKRPDLRGVHHALGELLLESGDYERAEAEFRAEARLTPGSAVTAYKLGVTLLHRGILQEAISELKRSNTLQPGMPETELELGRALHAAGEAEAAEHWLRKALQHESSGSLAASAHFLLAEIYRKQGRVAEADQEMKLFQRQRK